MYTSDKTLWGYVRADAGAAAFFMLFGAVYEQFSHEVYSNMMIYAFAVPLFAGLMPVLGMLRHRRSVPEEALLLWHGGLLSLTLWCIFQGVLEIYGTTNRLTVVYPVVGALLCLAAVGTAAAIMGRRKQPDEAKR